MRDSAIATSCNPGKSNAWHHTNCDDRTKSSKSNAYIRAYLDVHAPTNEDFSSYSYIDGYGHSDCNFHADTGARNTSPTADKNDGSTI